MAEDLEKLRKSVNESFDKALAMKDSFENSESPRQQKIVEILRKNNLPGFIGPFFDAYFRVTAEGGDIEKITILMISRLSDYLGQDPMVVAQRHRAAMAEYVEFMGSELGRKGAPAGSDRFVTAGG